ncbi:MAG: alpha/beta hydrolase [Steroidobacteraceae bacterium]|jgi:pimeloyl-ACP methyl ester carboxylesterase|nr:alpha/beta hydrolase [Steroidobacteraceae bacterium]
MLHRLVLAVLLASAVAGVARAADTAPAAALRYHAVTSADGVLLNVVESGPPDAPPVLFVHGIGQSLLSWRRQFEGPLAGQLRLVALDLRGHGDSGKPATPESYREACRWAEDLRAVQRALGLMKPVVVAWSFGGLVAMHYVRCLGTRELGGLVLVATAAGRLVSPPAGPPSAGAVRAGAAAREMSSPDLRRNLAGARDFAALMTARQPDAAWEAESIAALLRLPAYVRRALGTGTLGPGGVPVTTNADLATRLDLPLMVIAGGRDALSDGRALAYAYRARFPAAQVIVYEEAGHSPFAESPARFDADLAGFVSARRAPPRAAD